MKKKRKLVLGLLLLVLVLLAAVVRFWSLRKGRATLVLQFAITEQELKCSPFAQQFSAKLQTEARQWWENNAIDWITAGDWHVDVIPPLSDKDDMKVCWKGKSGKFQAHFRVNLGSGPFPLSAEQAADYALETIKIFVGTLARTEAALDLQDQKEKRAPPPEMPDSVVRAPHPLGGLWCSFV